MLCNALTWQRITLGGPDCSHPERLANAEHYKRNFDQLKDSVRFGLLLFTLVRGVEAFTVDTVTRLVAL